jgi:hypothetical protein
VSATPRVLHLARVSAGFGSRTAGRLALEARPDQACREGLGEPRKSQEAADDVVATR